LSGKPGQYFTLEQTLSGIEEIVNTKPEDSAKPAGGPDQPAEAAKPGEQKTEPEAKKGDKKA
jgi:hypothetical protein